MKRSLGAHTIAYPTPVFIIGSYDRESRPNAMAVAWGGICCSRPPCITISLRKATYSYGNIMERKAFTVNIPSRRYAAAADYFGIVSGRKENKFSVTGLTPVKSSLVDAPYIEEFPCVLECQVIHTHEIGLHTQFIGEILDVKINEDCFADKDSADIVKIDPMLYSPTNQAYYGVGDYLGLAFTIGRAIRDQGVERDQS
jgi:flavin reductase (DIM6/NTAB) family NADH-FMN oxidoreductase RutF